MSIAARRLNSLERVDALDPIHRKMVHEFGLPIVTVLLKHGVSSPSAMYEVVREIWAGPRQSGQRNDARGALDWLLSTSGSSLTAKGLYRTLSANNLFIVSAEPSRAMINASMAEVSGFAVRCTKEEKHRRRLRAAIRASNEEGGKFR